MLRTLHVLTSVILRTTLQKVYLLSSSYKWTDWCAKKSNQYLGSHSKYWGPGLKLEQCGSGVHAHGLGAIQLYSAHGPYFPVLVNLVLICLQRSLKMLGSTQSTLIRFCLFFGFCLFVYASERYLLWSCWFLIALLAGSGSICLFYWLIYSSSAASSSSATFQHSCPSHTWCPAALYSALPMLFLLLFLAVYIWGLCFLILTLK